MFKPKDHYTLLGISRNASQNEIRKAYLTAAKRFHPDLNVAPGETEFFISIQEAYEVLCDAHSRARYDASLPAIKESSSPISIKVIYSRPHLLRIEEPQIIYALLQFSPVPEAGSLPSPILNLCLVIDRSTSMKGRSMDVVKATTIQLLRKLRMQDTLSIITFSDRAETLFSSTQKSDSSKLEACIQMLHASGGTEIYKGLEAAFVEIQKNLDRSHINHIILLTDGHTYGDEHKCMHLAESAAEKGIGISGLGIGAEWNDSFLDSLARRTGGSSMYIPRPQEIRRILLEKLNHLWRVFAGETSMEFSTGEGVDLRYAFRLQPEAGMLSLESPLLLGPILIKKELAVLMELGIDPQACKSHEVLLLEGTLKVSASSLSTPTHSLNIHLSRPVNADPFTSPPPSRIIQALSHLTLYRLQEKARLEVQVGHHELASQSLQQLATHLLSQGEHTLAHTVLLEAEHIRQNKIFSPEGDKLVKYGTRALISPGQDIENHDHLP